jgi:hypothetical protein
VPKCTDRTSRKHPRWTNRRTATLGDLRRNGKAQTSSKPTWHEPSNRAVQRTALARRR